MAFIIDDIINAIGSWFAGEEQKKAAQEAMGLQRDILGRQQGIYDQSRADQTPWVQAGQTSLRDLLAMTRGGFDASSLAMDPGFQFRMAEGQKALERSAAARGGLNSGATLKSLARYSQGLASDEFGNRFNRLAHLAGIGQNSAQHLGGLGASHSGQLRGYADSMSNLYGAKGNASAAQVMGVTNGLSGGVRSLGSLAVSGGLPGQAGFHDVWKIPKQGGG